MACWVSQRNAAQCAVLLARHMAWRRAAGALRVWQDAITDDRGKRVHKRRLQLHARVAQEATARRQALRSWAHSALCGRQAAALRGGKHRHVAHWRAAASERKARLALAQRAAVRLVACDTARALGAWVEATALAVAAQRLAGRAAMRTCREAMARALATWVEASGAAAMAWFVLQRMGVSVLRRQEAAALRNWAAWRAARGAARAVASHALQRVLRAREAAALAAWREAAAATGRRRRLLRGAVQRFRHTAQARAWHSWAQHGRRPAPPTAQALQRLRRPGLAAALQCWAAHALVLGPLARSQALARAERATHMQLQRSVQRWAGRHRLARAFLCLHRHHALRRAIAAWRAVLSTSSVHRLRALAVLRVRHVPSPKLEAFWR